MFFPTAMVERRLVCFCCAASMVLGARIDDRKPSEGQGEMPKSLLDQPVLHYREDPLVQHQGYHDVPRDVEDVAWSRPYHTREVTTHVARPTQIRISEEPSYRRTVVQEHDRRPYDREDQEIVIGDVVPKRDHRIVHEETVPVHERREIVREHAAPLQEHREISREYVQPVQERREISREYVQPVQEHREISREYVQPVQERREIVHDVEPYQERREVIHEREAPRVEHREILHENVEPVVGVRRDISTDYVEPIPERRDIIRESVAPRQEYHETVREDAGTARHEITHEEVVPYQGHHVTSQEFDFSQPRREEEIMYPARAGYSQEFNGFSRGNHEYPHADVRGYQTHGQSYGDTLGPW
eukprot:TRINITY_DN2529_c0_g1_i3.p1 TRINITY_DN2529_c0_g1~~TRINITY_DN2529_c0_g1_i3.p1  ORF type:complete len:360 (+),score=30.63 TRINITY_DN2529_c0_g1_i3:35-1114(+)